MTYLVRSRVDQCQHQRLTIKPSWYEGTDRWFTAVCGRCGLANQNRTPALAREAFWLLVGMRKWILARRSGDGFALGVRP
jgi:hypothetical protein